MKKRNIMHRERERETQKWNEKKRKKEKEEQTKEKQNNERRPIYRPYCVFVIISAKSNGERKG